ncbi:MAG: glycosyltransferase family 4 protein [Anaerolineaceae bacterium]|nr:glycosyltransferase family 4 protein [Anaerolineaceae bacterium]
MKIVLLHYACPPVVGGVESVLAKQAELLTRAGHKVRVLAGRGETWNASIPVELLPVIDSRHPLVLRAKASLDKGIVPPDFQVLVDQISTEIERCLAGVDSVICHNVASLHKNLALTAALFNLSQRSTSPRFILWHHDLAWKMSNYLEDLHPGYPWDLLRTPWQGARQVTVSEARRQELVELMNIPLWEITVVPAGVDMAAFLNLSTRSVARLKMFRLNQSAPILLTPVRVTKRKNLELAISTLAALRHEMPQAALVVTGPPGAHNPANQKYLRKLKKMRSALGLDSAVHLLAESMPEGLSDDCVADLFRVADALLLPSRDEGFGIPILEAGLARMPIFCSNLGSLRALAGEWATYFSPEDSPDHVARLIFHRLRTDPLYQMRVRVRQQYTWDAIYHHQIEPLFTC